MNKILKKLFIIISFIFIYIMLYTIKFFDANEVKSLLVLIIMVLLCFKKHELYNKKYFKPSVVLSAIFSLINNYGYFIRSRLEIIPRLYMYHNIFDNIIVLFIMLYFIFINVLPLLAKYKLKKEEKKHKYIFVISFFVILAGWTIYLLNMYPGVISYDTLEQITYVNNHFANLSNHHPVLHTLFMAPPYLLGMFLTNDNTTSLLFVTITQMICMSLMFSAFIKYLYLKKVNIKILYALMFIIALVPNIGYMSICLWKDIIFAGLMILFTMSLIDICDSKKISNRSIVLFIIISLLTLFFRNNAIYMFILLTIFIFMLLKDKRKQLMKACFIVIAIYYIITIPVYKLLNIQSTELKEYIGIPIQQVARMVKKDADLTDHEKELINNVLELDKIKNIYAEIIVDNIKFDDSFNEDVIKENKFEYMKLYLSLIIKHPIIAIEAYSMTVTGYYYTDYEMIPIVTLKGEYEEMYNVQEKSILKNIEEILLSQNCPLIALLYSGCLGYFIIIVFNYICIKRRGIKYLIPYIPVYGIWLTILIASPSSKIYRYVFSQYTCLFILIALPFIDNTIRRKNK